MTGATVPARSGPRLVVLACASIGEVLDEVRAMGMQPSPTSAGLAIRTISGRRSSPSGAAWTSSVSRIGIGPVRHARTASAVAVATVAEADAGPAAP